MKKLLSIILTVCMLFSLVIVPITVNAVDPEDAYAESTLGGYYKFTFGEDDIYNYAFGATATYKENTFYPLWAEGTTGNKVGYKAVKDVDSGEFYDTLEIVNGSGSASLTPLTKEGKPFELKPGTEYTVKINMFNPVSHCWNQAYVAAGNNSKVVGSSSGTNLIEYRDGLLSGGTNYASATHPFYNSSSFSNQGGSAWAYSFLDGTYGKNTKMGNCIHDKLEKTCGSHNDYASAPVYISATKTIKLDAESYEYDKENSAYYADLKAYNFDRLDAEPEDWAENYESYYVYASWKFKANTTENNANNADFNSNTYYEKVDEKDVSCNNYLTLYLGGGDAHGNITSGPIYGNVEKANVYDAEGKVIPAYETYQIESIEVYESVNVTFVNGSSTSTKTYVYGDTISYSALTANINYDHVWSLSDTEYIPAPKTATSDITVYAYQNPVLSFENRVPFTYGSNVYYNVATGEDKALSGNKSVKFTNTVNDATLEGLTPIRDFGLHTDANQEYNFAYKVTFKYLATENNTAASSFSAKLYTHSNPWNGLKGGNSCKNLTVTGVNISAGATNGWQTAVMYISHKGTVYNNYVGGARLYLHLKFVAAAKDGDAITNEVYVDDVTIEEVPTVTFVSAGGSTSTSIYENGQTIEYPTTHPISATDYNNHYVWSIDPDTYVPAPLTANGDLTVYQIESDVMSFQHKMPVDPYLYKDAVPSVQYANEGYLDHRSARVKNYGVAQRSGVPDNWTADLCVKEMYYDKESDTYKNVTVDMYNEVGGDYDKFVAKYGYAYESRDGSNNEQANIPILQPSAPDNVLTANYKVTFKYKFRENASQRDVKAFLLVGNPINIWRPGGYQEIKDQYITLPYNESGEWQTATLYSVITNKNASSATPLVALKLEDAVAYKDYATFEILIDNVKVEEFENVPTLNLYANGEKIDTITEGLTAGGTYTPEAPTAPEGKYFAGWATAPNGANPVKTITMPSAGKALIVDYYAVFYATPKVVYHDGETTDTVTDGVTSGADYAIDRLGNAAADGKYFAGWSTKADGSEFVTKVTMPAAGVNCEKHLYAVYKDALTDTTIKFDYDETTENTGIGYIIGGNYGYQITGNGSGGQAAYGTPYDYTTDGLLFSRDNFGGVSAWNTLQQIGTVTEGESIAATTTEVPEGEYTNLGWSEGNAVVIRDENGDIFVPKTGVKYAALITYQRVSDGPVAISLAADRKPAYVTGSFGNSPSSAYATYGNLTIPENGDYELKTTSISFTVAAGENVPVLSLIGSSGWYGYRLADVEGTATKTNADGTATYYPYKITSNGRILIKEIQFIEVDAGKSVVTFSRYQKGVGYTGEIKEGVPEAPLDAETNNFDTKWYKSETDPHASNVVTTYPAADATYYSAGYMQANLSGSSSNYYANGKQNATGAEHTIDFYNKEVTDANGATKYALHVETKDEVLENDAEVFIFEPHVTSGHTYKVTYKYKANTNNSEFGLKFLTASAANYWPDQELCGSVIVPAGASDGTWTEQTTYFTVDNYSLINDENETAVDYSLNTTTRDTLYVAFYQLENENGNAIDFIDFEIEDLDVAIEAKGASILTDAAAQDAKMQAMRFYFDYKTVDGSTIELGNGEILTVVERGFIYRNGAADKNKDGVIESNVVNGREIGEKRYYTFRDSTVKTSKDKDFNLCWSYDEATSMMRFSTYVTGFAIENDLRKLEVRGYIVAKDVNDNTFTLYANKAINRTVDGVESATDTDINIGLPQQ